MEKVKVRFDGGASADGKAINFMSVSIDGADLYAETGPIPDSESIDEYGYDTLKAEIIHQAISRGIDARRLVFWWD